MNKVYVLSWNTQDVSEIIRAFNDPERAKTVAKMRCPDIGQWHEHNSHGLYWQAYISNGSYTVVEAELE